MKYLVIITLFLISLNSEYIQNNNGKIDMHGGKSDSLLSDKKSFSNSNFGSLGSISIKSDTKSNNKENSANKEIKSKDKN